MGRRTGAVLVSLLLLLTLAVSASAAAVKMTVGVRFWRESGDKESMADSAVDTTREATLTRQPNGTFTLELPVKQLSSMNMTGRLTGIAIGEVNYDGTLSGDLSDGTAVLTLKNLPASAHRQRFQQSAGRDLQHQDGHHPSRRHHYQCEDVHLGRALKSQIAQKTPRSSVTSCGALALFQKRFTQR